MMIETQRPEQFASDNYAGICPEALAALERANAGHARPYGDDPWTARACDRFREIFNSPCEVFFVFNGTAANSLALASLCRSYHSVVCSRVAHVETDECGAPGFFSHGAKLLQVETEDGRLQADQITRAVTRRTDIHYAKPRAVSLTQATELGTVYAKAQLQDVQCAARTHRLRIHMDGARFANAVVSLGVTPREITVDCGVDVLCLGGSKNGLGLGEAVIFFDLDLAEEFAYRCKQAGQLASKMRFIAAQWVGVLENDRWLDYARHANACAARLEERLGEIPEVSVVTPRQANAVFAKFPPEVEASLHARGWIFYTFIGMEEARLMCSWNTTEGAIEAFVDDLKTALRDRG